MAATTNYQVNKFEKWRDDYTFDNCKLNRREYGDFLIQYLVGEKNGFVLNLDGAWGTGKTEFLRRMYSELIKQGHPTIYIDAWESDFSQNPLQVVASELLKQLERFDRDHYTEDQQNNIKQACGKLLKFGQLASVGLLASGVDLAAGAAISLAISSLAKNDRDFAHELTNAYSEQIDAIQNLKLALEDIGEVFENDLCFANNGAVALPIFVLIDELDRCRPSYAIELLEVVKHFFSVKNFVFVMASDTTQLCHSIRAVYGQEFDSAQYLKRFFDRKAQLPMPDLVAYIDTHVDAKMNHLNNLKLYFDFLGKNRIINSLAQAYGLSIRDVDQLLHKLKACLRFADCQDEKIYLNLTALIIGLIEYDKNYDSFLERTNTHRVYQPPLNTELKMYSLIKIDTYINVCMQEVTLFKNDLGNHCLWHPKDMFSALNEDEVSSETKNALNGSRRAAYDSSMHCFNRIFLWEDIKKLIVLSGHIS